MLYINYINKYNIFIAFIKYNIYIYIYIYIYIN